MPLETGKRIYYGRHGQDNIWGLLREEPNGAVSIRFIFFSTRDRARKEAHTLNADLDRHGYFANANHWKVRKIELAVGIAGR